MIQFKNQFIHSSSDKVFEVLYGANADNEGFSFVYPFRVLALYMFFFSLSRNLSSIHLNLHGMIMEWLLILNSAIIWVKLPFNLLEEETSFPFPICRQSDKPDETLRPCGLPCRNSQVTADRSIANKAFRSCLLPCIKALRPCRLLCIHV
jgi:hypothetical protein